MWGGNRLGTCLPTPTDYVTVVTGCPLTNRPHSSTPLTPTLSHSMSSTAKTHDSLTTALQRVRNLDRLCDVLCEYISGFSDNLKGLKPYEAQLKAVVEELLEYERLTWRALIYCLDEAAETAAADAIKDFAEPLVGM